ncbi:MAG: imidazoleglycerol-phosphate dehydratase HisB [Thermoproteota archaeon]
MRRTKVERKTREVDITLHLNIDGKGQGEAETGIKFLNHMLITLAKHSLFDLKVKGEGDLNHHLCEDVALTLGKALRQALKEKKGIRRFGSAYVPMDESLARAVIDVGGRAYCNLNLGLTLPQIEDMKTEDFKHFFNSFAQASKMNLHLSVLYGDNNHHKVEAAVKALALALRQAVRLEKRIGDRIPSAKGVM